MNKKRDSRREFWVIFGFFAFMVLALGNAFLPRLAAQDQTVDVYREIEPIGDVLDIVIREYVRDLSVEETVAGAISGIMGALDRNSAYVSAEELEALRQETKGEFEGIGVSIKENEDGQIMVFMPILGSPALEAGIRPYDLITAIDGKSTEGLDTSGAANLIRGKRGSYVNLTILRRSENEDGTREEETFDVKVQRARIPLESIKEFQMLHGDIGYIRLSSFSDTTATDLEKHMNELIEEGMRALVLDLRWNSGGLLSASEEVCELFLPKGLLVTYTRGRKSVNGASDKDEMRLYTSRDAALPEEMPVIILTNSDTASASEIVTGALQFYQRALVVGQRTFGKGSVQTIIPLERPKNSALRLTTALYYTPADVTIDHQGILPDVEVEMSRDEELALAKQMYLSFENNYENQYKQNHGSMTPGYEVTEETVEDMPLATAVDIFSEELDWPALIEKYHKDIHETQMASDSNTINDPKRALKKEGRTEAEKAQPEEDPAELMP
ncbi:MAG: S41 family peptidase [Candidatus Hydrogenedens sp.]|jgi:carboxyl-terminal processing protease|nr:S41 family peptidase [Candidatus Hydrogenedens sp.]